MGDTRIYHLSRLWCNNFRTHPSPDEAPLQIVPGSQADGLRLHWISSIFYDNKFMAAPPFLNGGGSEREKITPVPVTFLSQE